jgi:hypothetical protein
MRFIYVERNQISEQNLCRLKFTSHVFGGVLLVGLSDPFTWCLHAF